MRFSVIYDACVLYPAPLRDFLMRLALSGLFAARWSDDIQNEWSRNLLMDRPELSGQVARTIDLMNLAVPDCRVIGYESLIPGLSLPDLDDRHVLAAAILAGAQLIVTFNLKDFPNDYLASFGIEAVHPDDFIVQQFDLHEARVISAAKQHRASLRSPPKGVEEYLDTLAAQGLVVAVDRLRDYQDFMGIRIIWLVCERERWPTNSTHNGLAG